SFRENAVDEAMKVRARKSTTKPAGGPTKPTGGPAKPAGGRTKPAQNPAPKSRPQPSKPPKAALHGHRVTREELTRVQQRLREAQETLDAIRSGEVDAVVVSGPNGNHVYSLSSVDQPYRVYLERMQEGAVTISAEGVIFYCNQRFADMVKLPLE